MNQVMFDYYSRVSGLPREYSLTDHMFAFFSGGDSNGLSFGAVGDGVTDNTDALLAALDHNRGKATFLPAGVFKCSSAVRILLEGDGTSLVGDPSGLGTQIVFTNAAGGLDIGNGVDPIYEVRLASITIVGSGVTTNTVRCRKMYEPYFDQVRIESGSMAVGSKHLELQNCGQLDANRLVISGSKTAIEVTGTDPSLLAMLRLANFYNCENGVRIATGAAGGVPKIRFEDSWFEAVANVFTFDTPGVTCALGQLCCSNVRFLMAAGDFRLVKAVAGTGVSGSISFDTCQIAAAASLAPLVDFTALNNSAATLWVEFPGRLDIILSGANTQPLVKPHAAQAFNNFKTKFDVVIDSNTTVFDPGRWSALPMQAGGTWPEPYFLHSVNSPEGVWSAPIGSLYRRDDVGQLYMKATGTGNTGWKLVTQAV